MEYELEVKSGSEWLPVTSADTMAEIREAAQNICAEYRVLNTDTGRYRKLDVELD